jgi:PKD repeat protein
MTGERVRLLSARGSRIDLAGCLLAIGACLAVAPAVWAAPAQPTHTRYAQIVEACPAPEPGHATCFALVRRPVKAPAPGTTAPRGVQPYVVGGGAALAGPAGGLTPEDLASAYGYDPTVSGSGQTVGIVDAFDDPAIESDLGEFNAHYGLPQCTTANGCFKKVGQTGSASSLPAADKTGWSVEIALDVETVHAACPKCKILLVEADNSSNSNLAAAVNTAVTLGATEVSNSYGGPEVGTGATEQAAYEHPGLPIVASTGDDGYYGWDWVNEGFFGDEMPSAPASLPSVVAVGGTSLDLNSNGTRADETVWNNNGPGDEEGLASEAREGATGGGCSKRFAAQLWQRAVANFAAGGCGEKRLDADVSAVADPLTGLDIYDTYNCGAPCNLQRVEVGWVTIGGTSLSAPFISSLYALAGGGQGVNYPALTLYGHSVDSSLRFDVTEGANGFCGGESNAECGKPNSFFGDVDCEGTTACNAVSGFDGPSGIGTPKGLGLFKPLHPTASFTTPISPKAGLAVSFNAVASSDPYPGGSIAEYSWSWGDGTPGSEGVAPSHTYATAGKYVVSLTVTDNYGLASASSTKSVEVTAKSAAEEEAAKHEQEEAAAKVKREEEERSAAKHKQEEEAAAGKRHEEQLALVTATATTTTAATTLAPDSSFTSGHASVNAKTGAITLSESVVDPGAFRWLATFANGRFGAFASSSKCKTGFIRLAGRCRPAKIVFARGSKAVAGAGAVSLTLKPSASATKALKNALKKGKKVPVSLTLTFQSSRGGSPVTRVLSLTVKLKK